MNHRAPPRMVKIRADRDCLQQPGQISKLGAKFVPMRQR